MGRLMIDATTIRITLYDEYQKTMRYGSWRSFEHFLLVRILRLSVGQPWLQGATDTYLLEKRLAELEEFKRKVYAAYTPGKHCRLVDLEAVLLEEIAQVKTEESGE